MQGVRRRAMTIAGTAVLTGVLVFAAGCGGAGGDKSSPSPSATPTASVTPLAGSVKVQGFSFVPPKGLTRVTRPADRANPKASYEMSGKAKPPTSPPTLDVFVERGDIGSLRVRAAQIIDLAHVQLRNVEVVQNKPIKVPGATAAQLIELSFTCTGTTGKAAIPCRQFEVLVQMPHKPQYGLRYGMATKQYDAKAVQQLLGSMRAQP